MTTTQDNTTPTQTEAQASTVSAKAIRKGRAQVEKKAVALERLTISYVAPDALKPNSYNPNRQSEHDFDLLLRSIQEDGFTQPIIAQQDGFWNYVSRQRYKGAKGRS